MEKTCEQSDRKEEEKKDKKKEKFEKATEKDSYFDGSLSGDFGSKFGVTLEELFSLTLMIDVKRSDIAFSRNKFHSWELSQFMRFIPFVLKKLVQKNYV